MTKTVAQEIKDNAAKVDHGMATEKVDLKHFAMALQVIADVFSEPYETVDLNGQVSVRNRLGFLQENVLNGVCYRLNRAIDYTVNESLPKAERQLDLAQNPMPGTEVDGADVERRQEWVDRLNDQVMLASDAYEMALRIYAGKVGRPFTPPGQGRAPVSRNAAVRNDRIRQLGIEVRR